MAMASRVQQISNSTVHIHTPLMLRQPNGIIHRTCVALRSASVTLSVDVKPGIFKCTHAESEKFPSYVCACPTVAIAVL